MNSSPETRSNTPLNPALKSRSETVYDTRTTTPAPIETASAKEGEGEGWPWVWLVIALLCIGVTLYLVL